MASAPVTVAITGASGYIAGPIIEALSQRGGYTVRGTVRSTQNQEKTAHLQPYLDSGFLTLFEADLLQPGTFDDCFTGATYVLHVASPFQPGAANPQEELIDPAVNGTNNVLEAALRSGVKRVVVTSSCAAVVQMDKSNYADDYVWSEADWNDTATIEGAAYPLSKVMAEKAAWAFNEQHQNEIEVAVINPSFVLGPPLSSRLDSTSVKFMVGLLSGKFRDGAAPRSIPTNDVRDLAQAHLAVMLNEEAKGNRHCVTRGDGFTMLDIANALREKEQFQSYPLPTTYASPTGPVLKLNNGKIRGLGVDLRPIEQTVCDMAEDLIAKGLVQIPAESS